ncbi:MAG: hypothetical protein HY927_00395 [Elusimicrobia bacterium]|nr:hypothetical protein [Elusimicrobiota bacterium]
MKLFLLALLLARAPGAFGQDKPALRWPAPPAPARLEHVRDFTGEGVGAAKSKVGGFFRRLLGIDASGGDPWKRRLAQPTGVAVSTSGVLYVADSASRSVLRHDLASGRSDWLNLDSLKLANPVSVAAAPDGGVFVLDSVLRKVFILDPAGKPVGSLEGDPEGLGRPAGLAVGGGKVFVSDTMRHRVGVYGLEGVFIHSFGSRGRRPGELNYPTYLWYDAGDGELWVCDSGNFRLQRFSADGKPLGLLGEPGNRPGYMARPRGVARDSDGHVFVTDAAFDALQVFDPAGPLLLFVGHAGPSPGEFNLPGGVFIDDKDRVFVADTFNARVQIFQYLKEKGQ